jgi:opine dehydrogenase
MEIAVLGAGAGGQAAAAVLARGGHRVRLYNRSPGRLEPLRAAGGVTIAGDQGDGFVPLPHLTSDAAEAARGAEAVLIFVGAHGQADVARAIAPALTDGQLVVFCSGSAGSLEAARLWREGGLRARVLLGETVSLPQSARITGPAQLKIRLPVRPHTAAFPADDTDRLRERLAPVFETQPAVNVLDTGLNNPNFLIHPAPMVVNYAAIERTDGALSLMNEGMTPATLRLMDAHDAEKLALARALGLPERTLDDVYTSLGSGPHVYRQPGEPMGLRDRIHWRYIDEDVPMGTVLWSSLGRAVGVPTPLSDGIVAIAGALRGTDYWAQGRTVETLGLAGLDAGGIAHYLATGERPAERRT